MTEQEIEKKHAAIFEALRKEIARLNQVLETNEFSSENPQHVATHQLALRLIEFSTGCHMLAKAGLAAANAATGRTCLEVGFKLKAICKSMSAADIYNKQEDMDRLAKLKPILSNQEMRAYFSEEDLKSWDNEILEIESELNKTKTDASKNHASVRAKKSRKRASHDKKTVYSWAVDAGEEEVYRFAYSIFSDFTHSGPGSMKHICNVSSKGQFFMQTGPSDHMVDQVIGSVSHCLASASNAIEGLFAQVEKNQCAK
ncbi:MAG: DUF5677 domain-containing protein [Acidovorax sp.]|uniref:DUF5677 domain-containing protein n=1 Tax=Acidovorax sp. TaxID=1872122 RepID=UPI003919C87E